MNKDFLNDVYKDFFGEGGRTPEDAVKNAEDALQEVEKLFGNLQKKNSDDLKELEKEIDALNSHPLAGGLSGLSGISGRQDSGAYPDSSSSTGKTPGSAYPDGSSSTGKTPESGHTGGSLSKPDGSPSKEETPEGGETGRDWNEAAAVQAEPEKPKEPEKPPLEQLNELIGLAGIKHDVMELTDFAKVQKMRRDQGMKSVPVSLHLVFTGNPGTGKTTVARIIGKLYAEIGILSGGQLVEVDRSGLVAGYVGQTALKTQEKIQEALGGVLFIDEAYALAKKDDAFGQEAIDTVLKAMEDHRDDLVVIVAGYTKPMEEFINSNPGLKSRFNKYIEFPDYSIDELEEIFYLNCKRYDYTVEEEAKKQIRALIVARRMQKQENFANAREVRNLFEEIITNQARRLASAEAPTADDMRLICMEDLMEEAEVGALPQPDETENAEDTYQNEGNLKDSVSGENAVQSTDSEPDDNSQDRETGSGLFKKRRKNGR